MGAGDDQPEQGTAEYRRNVLYSLLADEFRPEGSAEYHDLILGRCDTPERVFTVYRRDPAGDEEYVTTLNISGFRDADELARHLGSIGVP